jgi:hypothetical protein
MQYSVLPIVRIRQLLGRVAVRGHAPGHVGTHCGERQDRGYALLGREICESTLLRLVAHDSWVFFETQLDCRSEYSPGCTGL